MSQKGIQKTKPKTLPVIETVNGITCFAIQKKYNVQCERSKCFHWIDSPNNCNCVIIAAQEGPKTLQEIGEFFDLTRMRICQIEKSIYEKLDVTD